MSTSTETAPARRRSRLFMVGRDAMRAELLSALDSANWNLTAASLACGLTGPSDVLRMIPRLGLSEEYAAAKRDGRVSPGSRIAK